MFPVLSEMKEEYRLKRSYQKILGVVEELETLELSPNADGIYEVLKGLPSSSEPRTTLLPLFGELISLSRKRTKNALHLLVRHAFLKQRYDDVIGDYFFILTESGRQNAFKAKAKKEAPKKETKRDFIPLIKN